MHTCSLFRQPQEALLTLRHLHQAVKEVTPRLSHVSSPFAGSLTGQHVSCLLWHLNADAQAELIFTCVVSLSVALLICPTLSRRDAAMEAFAPPAACRCSASPPAKVACTCTITHSRTQHSLLQASILPHCLQASVAQLSSTAGTAV